jgi:type II secretory ATPase GspE/PulE/Tfp pilus assembly ATPase PilB-like protein
MGIFELMLMSPKIREMTFRQAPVADIRRVAIQEGMRTLYMDGLQKVLRGRTTLEELLSVARPEEELR